MLIVIDCITHAVSPRVRCTLEHEGSKKRSEYSKYLTTVKRRITIVAHTISFTTNSIKCVQKIKGV
jgi:hypothetical protein